MKRLLTLHTNVPSAILPAGNWHRRDMSRQARQKVRSLAAVVEREISDALSGAGSDVGILDELLGHGFCREELFDLVVPRRTLARRRQAGERLSPEESDRAVRLARIAAQAERVFGSPTKAHGWLREPSRSLNGAVPLNLLRTETGAHLVEQKLHQIDYGMFA